jgi:RimJ/RimL family protein N-acetyltransferase
VTIIETPRLIFRKFTLNDLDQLAPILGDPEVMKFSVKGVKTKEETKEFINWMLSLYEKYGFGLYAVIYKENKQLIGFCGLLVWFFDNEPEIEIGYRFAKEFWEQGLGTEAATAVRDYAWKNLDTNRLICVIEPENIRSINVAKKLGMKHERDTIFMSLDVSIYSIKKY